MTDALIQDLHAAVGEPHVLTTGDLGAYERDWRERWHGKARAVVRPARTAEVAAVVRACAAHGVAVEALRAANWRVGILSGDHPRVVAAAGARLGLAPAGVRGGVSPEDKLQVVLAERASGPVVMVGDGVNDAAALSAATVGIGVHGGAEASLAAADVFAARPGLAPVVALMEGARRTLAVVRRNLVLSLVYNTAGVGLAMAGLIDPLIAAVMMPANSLTVIISSYRAQMFREDPR